MSKISLAKWAVGGTLTYLGYKYLFEDSVFEHIRLTEKRDTVYSKKDFGVTTTEIFFDFDIFWDEEKKSYKAKLKKFRFISRIELNAGNDIFQNIKGFEKYYRPLKDYVYADYDSGFNTIEGTRYHESLHQDEIDDVMKRYKPLILEEINRIESGDELKAKDAAAECLNSFKRFFEGKNREGANIQDTPESKKRHKEIDLLEWRYLHDQYKEWMRKNK